MTDTETKDLIGTLYVDPQGNAYRLRDYGIDWSAIDDMDDDLTGVKETVPNYSVQYVRGSMSNVRELPEGSVVVWTPDLEGWEPVEPIKAGHQDVWRCLGPNCGALVRLSDRSTSRQQHDAEFHANDKITTAKENDHA